MYNPRGASSTPRSLEYTLSEHPSRITFVTWSKPRSVPTTCLPSLVMTCTRASTIPANDGACPPPPPPPPLAARIIATNRPTNNASANAGRPARIARTRTTTRAPTNEGPAPRDGSIDGRHPDGGAEGGAAGAGVRALVFTLVLWVFIMVCRYNQADTRTPGRTVGRARRSPPCVVRRSRRSCSRGVARGARDEARASFARASRCEGAGNVFRDRIVASFARERRRGRAERLREGGARRPISRARRSRIVREREISEEEFATSER